MTDERWVWSRAYSDEVQTGPSTPMFYTELESRITTLKINSMLWTDTTECLGYPAERFRDIPFFRWYGARAYYNLAWEREHIRMFIPPFARDEAALWPFPAGEREEIRRMPFNWIRFLWIILKLHVTDPNISLLGTTQYFYENMERWTNHEAALVGCARLGDGHPTGDPGDASAGRQGQRVPSQALVHDLPATSSRRRCGNSSCTGAQMSHTSSTAASAEGCTPRPARRTSRCGGCHARSRRRRRSHRCSPKWRTWPRSSRGYPRRRMDRPSRTRSIRSSSVTVTEAALNATLSIPGGATSPELVFLAVRPMLRLDDDEDPALVEEALHARMLAAKQESLRTVRRGIFGAVKSALPQVAHRAHPGLRLLP